MCFHSVKDLRNWVDSHLLDGTSTEVDAVTLWVQWDSERPNWGQNWESYLDSLPEDLRDLLG